MIIDVGFTNSRGERLKVPLRNSWESGLVIKSITGLGPVKSSISTSDIATGDGAYITNTRTGTRNIVVNFAYLSSAINTDIEAIRIMTYKYFVPNEEITVQIRTDHREVYATGVVESNEPDIFSNLSGCQVSIICPYPYFYDINETEMHLGAYFSSADEMLEGASTDDYVTYNGEVPVGVHAEISVSKITTGKMRVRLIDSDHKTFGGDFIFDFSLTDTFASGGTLIFDSMWGNKQVYGSVATVSDSDLTYSSAALVNLIAAHTSGWPQASEKDNKLVVWFPGVTDVTTMNLTAVVTFSPLYLGV